MNISVYIQNMDSTLMNSKKRETSDPNRSVLTLAVKPTKKKLIKIYNTTYIYTLYNINLSV